ARARSGAPPAPCGSAPTRRPDAPWTSVSVAHLGGRRRRLGAGLRAHLSRTSLAFALAIVATPLVAIVAIAAALAAPRGQGALRLLQVGARPLAVQVVLLDVVLRLGPHGDALVELHHQEPHRLALRPLQQLGHLGVARDDDLVFALLARGALHLAHDLVRHRHLAADVAPAVASRAALGGEAGDALVHALARHLHQGAFAAVAGDR